MIFQLDKYRPWLSKKRGLIVRNWVRDGCSPSTISGFMNNMRMKDGQGIYDSQSGRCLDVISKASKVLTNVDLLPRQLQAISVQGKIHCRIMYDWSPYDFSIGQCHRVRNWMGVLPAPSMASWTTWHWSMDVLPALSMASWTTWQWRMVRAFTILNL